MLISRYLSNFDGVPKVVDLSWDDLSELLTHHTNVGCFPCPGKGNPKADPPVPPCSLKHGAAWSPCEVHQRRANANVIAFSCAVFDIDHVPMSELERIDALLQQRGLAAIMHSTHSHNPPDDCCVRLVLQVSRLVKPHEWARFRSAVIADLGLPADPSTKDLARIYYLPSWPGGEAPDPIAGVLGGAPLDVDAYLKAVPEPAHAESMADEDSEHFDVNLGDLAKMLLDSARGADPEKRALIKAVIAGEPIAEPGARDATLNKACSIIVWALPSGTPEEAILELMRRSIRAMPGDEPPEHWEQEARDMIARAALRRTQDTERRTAWARNLMASMARESAADAAKDEPESEEKYSEEQIARWAEEQGAQDFTKRWIIQSQNAYYVFVNGRYKTPISKEELAVSLLRDLARAPIDTFSTGKDGNTMPTPVGALLKCHATVARRVQASLTLQKSYYDERSQTFYEAVTPLRKIVPVEHPEVHEWLNLLGGAERDKLLDWIATITMLEKQSCAIYLKAPPGAGKTLLANGLARLWHEGAPPPLEDVLETGFNELIAQCPLLFADEALPKHDNITSALRKLIGSPGFALKRKYIPTTTVQGSVRLIIAGNNAHLLQPKEDLSADDLAAVSSRFLYIESDEKAAAYLRDFGDLNRWIKDDTIAEHALWLRETRSVLPGRRFLVEGTQREFHEQLAVSSGLANSILEWIAKYLDDPQGATSTKGALVLAGHGYIMVSAEVFTNEYSWNRYVPSQKVQSTTRVGKVLVGLSDFKDRIRIKERQHTFHSIPPARLFTWIRATGAVDLENVIGRVYGPNEVLRKSLEVRGLPVRSLSA